MDINNSASVNSERSEKHSIENLYCLNTHINHYYQSIGRNMDIKEIAHKGSEEN